MTDAPPLSHFRHGQVSVQSVVVRKGRTPLSCRCAASRVLIFGRMVGFLRASVVGATYYLIREGQEPTPALPKGGSLNVAQYIYSPPFGRGRG